MYESRNSTVRATRTKAAHGKTWDSPTAAAGTGSAIAAGRSSQNLLDCCSCDHTLLLPPQVRAIL